MAHEQADLNTQLSNTELCGYTSDGGGVRHFSRPAGMISLLINLAPDLKGADIDAMEARLGRRTRSVPSRSKPFIIWSKAR